MAIVTPFWVWRSARFAKRTAPSGGMREMCINNKFTTELLSSVGACSRTSASITSILQSTKIFFSDFHQYDQEQRAMCRVATASSES